MAKQAKYIFHTWAVLSILMLLAGAALFPFGMLLLAFSVIIFLITMLHHRKKLDMTDVEKNKATLIYLAAYIIAAPLGWFLGPVVLDLL